MSLKGNLILALVLLLLGLNQLILHRIQLVPQFLKRPLVLTDTVVINLLSDDLRSVFGVFPLWLFDFALNFSLHFFLFFEQVIDPLVQGVDGFETLLILSPAVVAVFADSTFIYFCLATLIALFCLSQRVDYLSVLQPKILLLRKLFDILLKRPSSPQRLRVKPCLITNNRAISVGQTSGLNFSLLQRIQPDFDFLGMVEGVRDFVAADIVFAG